MLNSGFPLSVCFTHVAVFMSSLISRVPRPLLRYVCTSGLCVCISIPALELGSSAALNEIITSVLKE